MPSIAVDDSGQVHRRCAGGGLGVARAACGARMCPLGARAPDARGAGLFPATGEVSARCRGRRGFKSAACLPSAEVMLRALAAVLGLVSAWLAFDRFVLARPIEHGPGIIAPQAPVQEALDRDEVLQFTKAGFLLRALASFELEARVLGVESYCCWGSASLVPVDVAFGWGRMSDEEVLSRIEITQGRRFYFWRYEGSPPVPRQEIVTSSANMHLIASTPAIERAIKRLRRGHLVHLSGYLVEARGDDGFRWRSSLTRADSGNGACELVWVEELSVR